MRGNHLVREMRKRAGLTQAQLAERTGTTQSAVARLERGQGSPTLERLSTIAEACGLDLQVHLVDADDHDWTLVDRSAASHRDTRVEGLKNLVRFAEAGRAAMADARERRRDAVRA
jgi:transcriptional regulator with XRE-family HTH domain